MRDGWKVRRAKRFPVIGASLVLGVSFALAAQGAATGATAEEPGISAKSIKVGSTKNMNEAEDPRPSGFSRGEKLFFDKLNKAGGVHGRTIQFLEYDDAHDPKTSAENVKKLINEDKVFLLFGSYGTANLKASAPISAAAGVPSFAVAASVAVLPLEQQKFVFGVKGTYIDEAAEIVNFAVVKKGWDKLAIFSQDDALGGEGRGGLIKALHDRSLKPQVTKNFSRTGIEVDEKWLPDLQASGVQAILMFGNEKGGLRVLEMMEKKGVKLPVLVGSPLIAGTFIKRIAEMNREAYFFQGYPLVTQPEIPIVAEYLKDIGKNDGKPNDLELTGYVDAAIFSEALRLMGSKPSRRAFMDAVEKHMTNFSFKGIQVSFSPERHSGMKQVRTYTVKSGVLSPL